MISLFWGRVFAFYLLSQPWFRLWSCTLNVVTVVCVESNRLRNCAHLLRRCFTVHRLIHAHVSPAHPHRRTRLGGWRRRCRYDGALVALRLGLSFPSLPLYPYALPLQPHSLTFLSPFEHFHSIRYIHYHLTLFSSAASLHNHIIENFFLRAHVLRSWKTKRLVVR